MASEEYQEQPGANQPSSNSEEQESLKSPEIKEESDQENIHSEDIITSDKAEPSPTIDSVAEEDIQAQQPPETESSPAIPLEVEEEKEASFSVTPSPPIMAEQEEEVAESTTLKSTQENVAESQPQETIVPGRDNKNWWDVIIDKIRGLLPESINNSLSDWVLIGIISSLIVIILSISVFLLPSRSSSYIAQEPAEIVSISQPEKELTIDSTPTKEIEETEISAQSAEITTPPVEVEIDNTETLVIPKKTESLTLETTPPPQPVLTPEQSLFNSVQEKINEITSQYSDELIVSGKADLLSSHLLIKVSDDWYQLNKSRQDEFANETLKRSQKFNFNKLEIQDVQNNPIARSPVVGNKMIILQRTN